ncbi:MAG: thiolase [Candidatus Rokubacteria bacterium]|nr:thiolase [Candidatus Rokubacteria bacterium]
MRSFKGQVAIVGVGETAVGKVPGRSALWFNAEATRLALEDAGIDKSQVDGLVTAPSFVAPFPRMSVAVSEYLGIQPTFSNTLNVSGATAAASVNVAAAAIHAGLADTVVVCCGDNMLSGLTRDLAVKALIESRDPQYEAPFGLLVATTFALTAQRHMAEYGTTPEQLARVAVVTRGHALKKPGAHMTAPITVEDVLASKPITTPYHMLDCALVSDGGAAFVLTAAERARDLRKKPVYLLGGGESYTQEHIFCAESITTTGAAISSRRAYAMAGVGPGDIDVAGIYDCFTGTVIMMLEDLGFCKKGEGGPFVEAGQITHGGRIPINTHGGMLSYAHPGLPGGFFHIVEMVRQLRGEAGERQVAGAELTLCHSLGGGFATNATIILGTEANG